MGKQVHGILNLENRSKVIALKATTYSCLWLEDEVKMKNNSYSSSAHTVIYLEIIYKYYSTTANPINNNDKLLLSFIIGTVNFAGRNKQIKRVISHIAGYILLN